MPGFAARLGDTVKHDAPHCHAPIHPAAPPTPLPHLPQPIPIVAGCPTVNIGGTAAARVGDLTAQCIPTSCIPGGSGAIALGSVTVRIGGLPAARVGDTVSFPGCAGPIPCLTAKVTTGCTTVTIG
jgi:uncharacterized Zn-binding protein involved in type VI secretion